MPNSKATVSGDFSNLISGAENAAKKMADLGLKISGLAAAAKGIDVATTAVGGLVTGLGKIGLAASGIEAIGKSTASMGMALLQGNANLEMTTISFKTLLGSASAANDMIKQLTQFAATTPFNLPGLEASTQKLLAFGFQAKDIVPMMTSMGDAIAALGGTQANLDSLVYVMGQMHSEAHINAGDIMQMTNLGIPALQMLADHYKVTTGEMQNMISKGLVPGTAAVDIFTTGLEKKYGGMMAAQSATFSGMISNLQDWATATTITLTKPFFEPAKKALAAFLAFVQSPAGVAAINRLAAYIQEGVDRMTAAFVRFEPKIKPTFERLLQLAQVLRTQMTPGIFSLIPLLFQFWTRIEPVALALFKFYQAIQPLNIALAALRGLITGGLPGALAALQDRFAMISGYVKIGLNAALVEVKKFGPAALTWISNTAISIAQQALTWGEALIRWVAPYAARLVGELINLGGQALNWVVGFAPVLANQVLIWAEAIAGWIIPAIPRVLNALVQLGLGIVTWAEREAPIFLNTMLLWGDSLIGWVLPYVPQLLNTLGQLGTTILTWAEHEAPILLNAFFKWTDILASWIIPAIPGVIRSLEQLGGAIVNWGVTRLPALMGQVAVGIGDGLGVNLRGPVGDVLLIFNALVNNIRSTVLPAFREMMGYLAANVQPLLNRLAAFIANTIIPTLAALAAFTMKTLVPAFVTAADLLGRVFGPALTLIGSIIRNDLLPFLSSLWATFEQNYLPTVRNLASEFGEHLAGGIQTAIGKFQDALPAIDGFIAKALPVIQTILGIAAAFSPVITIFDVFKGFLTGGTDGAIAAFRDRVNGMGKILGIDLLGAFDGVVKFIQQSVIPAIHTLVDWFGAHIIPMAQAVAKTFMADIVPALGRFWDFTVKNIIPALGDFFDWFSDKIIPVLGKLVAFVLDTVIPVLFNWWKTIATILKPIIEWLAQFISDTLIPAFTNIGKFINEKVLPVVTELAQNFERNVMPVLKTVGDFLGGGLSVGFTVISDAVKGVGWVVTNILLPAFNGMWHFITDWVLPILGAVSEIFGNTIRGAITGFGWVVDNLIVPGFNTIKTVVGNVVDFIKTAVKTVANFFIDAINTPINLIDTLINALKNFEVLGQKPFSWLPTIPTLGYLSFAKGTRNAPGGLSLVGEQGMELVRLSADKLILATHPMLLNLPKGAQVFNNQQTMNMLPSPASPQQISNMYATTNANRSWDYSQNNSQVNSHNNTYYINGQQGGQMPFGQQMRWYGAK